MVGRSAANKLPSDLSAPPPPDQLRLAHLRGLRKLPSVTFPGKIPSPHRHLGSSSRACLTPRSHLWHFLSFLPQPSPHFLCFLLWPRPQLESV